MQELPSLTSLRFFAALVVVLFHFQNNVVLPQTVVDVLQYGSTGVDLFFMLSGFILCYVYASDPKDRPFDYPRFLVKRLARIYPVHLVTLLVMCGWMLFRQIAFGRSDYDPADILPNVALIHAWGVTDGLGWNYPSWSISAEWFAYLLFPAFLLLRYGPGIVWFAVASATLTFVYIWLGSIGAPLPEQVGAYSLVRVSAELALGVALYLAASTRPSLTIVVCGVFGIGAVLGFLFKVVDFQLVVLAIFPTIIFSLYRAPWVLAHPWLVYGGKISFSVYMVHALVQVIGYGTVEKLTDYPVGKLPTWWLLPGLFVTLVLAAGIYHGVEEPMRRRITSWGLRTSTRSLDRRDRSGPVNDIPRA